jgi:hypothetical protein
VRAPLRRLAAAAAVGVLLGSLFTGPRGRAGAQVAPGPGASRLSLVDRSPWISPGGTVELDVATPGASGNELVEVRVHAALDSPEELRTSMEENVGPILHRSPSVPLGFVPTGPDGSRTIRIPTSTATTGDPVTATLPDPGVYPVVIALEEPSGEITEVRTPLIRLGTAEEPLVAPRLEILADLSVPPTVLPDGRRQLTEDELERLGRVGALLEGSPTADPEPGAAPVDATVSVSPDTLDALTASGDDRAAPLLDALDEPSAERVAMGLPSIPLSAPAVLEADLDLFLVALVAAGRGTLEDRLEIPVETALWDAGDGIDRRSAETLAQMGLTHYVVGTAPAPDASPAQGPGERDLVDAGPHALEAGAPLEALLVDTATSRALAGPAGDRADAAHVVLADLLLRDGGRGTRVVVRVDDVPAGSRLAHLVSLATRPGSPVEIGPVTPGPAAGPGVEPDVEPAPVPDGFVVPDPSTDLTGVASTVLETSTAVDSFAGLVGDDSARADSLRQRIATSLATGLPASRRRALLDSVQSDVDSAFDGIALTGQTDLNLPSRSGTLPLQLANENEFPVQVVLRISSDRLRFPEGERYDLDAAEGITRIDIPVEVRASGSVPTFVRITTPDGRVLLDDRRLDVRSTAISGVGLALSLGALAVLVIWWARSWRRNRPGSSAGRPGGPPADASTASPRPAARNPRGSRGVG